MRTPPRATGLVDTATRGLAIALVFLGFACGSGKAPTNGLGDSGAKDGASSDGNPIDDSPSASKGESDGAAATATGGAKGTGGRSGTGDASGLPDATLAGTGGAAGTGGGARDAPRDSGAESCTFNGTVFAPGQSFAVGCFRYTCVSGTLFTVTGAPCADAAGLGGAAGAVDASSEGSGGSTSSTGGSGGTSGMDGSGSPPALDAACSSVLTIASQEPADVLLVLDRSGSMSYSMAQDCYCDSASGTVMLCDNPATCTTRWTSLTSALNTTLSSAPNIRWGLKLYSSPGGSTCSVSTGVEVPIGANSTAAIETMIGNVSPGNNTPTAAAVAAATAYLKTVGDSNSKVMVLVTDGEPNCAAGTNSSTADVPGAVNAIASAASAGFLVYVIGIGPSVGNLDMFALAGGTGSYYPATSSAELDSALASISKAVTQCTYTLSMASPDPSNLGVYLDKNLVPKDAANGWSFGASASSIVLNGSFCDKVTSGAASTVQVYSGCSGSPPPMLP